jgi:hypothetical protein
MTDQTPIPRNGNGIQWTTDMMLRLSELWHAEPVISPRQISETLTAEFGVSVSRNAALGKAHRLGFAYRNAPANITEARTRKANGEKREQLLKPAPKPQYVRAADTPFPAHLPIPAGDKEARYGSSLLCRWPQVTPNDPIRCTGTRVEGRPYCDGHCRRAYTSFGVEYPKSTTVWLSSAGSIRRGQ